MSRSLRMKASFSKRLQRQRIKMGLATTMMKEVATMGLVVALAAVMGVVVVAVAVVQDSFISII